MPMRRTGHRLLERFTKPEYLMQPRFLIRRLRGQTASPGADGSYSLPLPWDLDLRVRRLDSITRAVDVLGVHDLIVTEAIWRLVAPGDTVVDVGANVGYMTLAMIARLGERGRVLSFEPQPGVGDELVANVAAARARFPGVQGSIHFEALSDSTGTASIVLPPGSDENRGLAHLAAPGAGVSVRTQRLDDYASELGPRVSLVKIDVEGHEPAVLRGATTLLQSGALRHIIFEEHGAYPTETSLFLERFGYTIFTLERSLLRVRIGDPSHPRRAAWEAPSLLATREPDVALRAFRPIGWRSLSH
jgi:FkbM family methyltransferase